MYFLTFISLSLFISGSSSFTVINNVTVSSDVLKEIFFKQIRNSNEIKNDFPQESISGGYNSEKCLQSLSEIVRLFPRKDVMPFLDAWGHIPSGILYKNTNDAGNFDQCVATSVFLKELSYEVKGQFCFATANLPLDLGKVNVGICIPDTCSPEYLAAILQRSSNQYLEGSLKDISVQHCTDGKIEPLTTINIVAITIFSVVAALMILSSIYEFYMDYFNKTPVPVLLAFSILTNGKRLFAINTKRSRNSIDCFNGLRVLSTFYIMNHHTYTNIFGIPLINQAEYSTFTKSFVFMPFATGSMSVDTFFFIGGTLVAWTGFRDLDKTKGKMNVFMNIVHRYIRLTPVVAVGLLMHLGIHSLLFTGPYKQAVKTTCDATNWWTVILYIQNYYFPAVRCYDETWYLAVDFQLYALSPLILIPMWKWGKKFIPVVVALIVASIGYVIFVFISNGFTAYFIGPNLGEWEKTYVPTHTRCASWLMGLIFGYFIHYNRQANFRISKTLQLLAWIGSFSILLSVLLLPYFPAFVYGSSPFETAMYEGFKRIGWTTALIWITFACYYGFGGIVDTFLSHPFWQPLTRLTYAIYLMHVAIERMHFGMTRTSIHFSVYNNFLYFWSAFGISLLLAIFVTLGFESPILILEKFIFGGGKPTVKPIIEEQQPLPLTHTLPNNRIAPPSLSV